MQSYRDRLVEDNIRLVYYVYEKKLNKTHLTIDYKDDLISEGMLGLVKAAGSYSPERSAKFATYATQCIRNQMLMFIRKLNKFAGKEVSLYAPIGNDGEGNELCLADVLEDKKSPQDMHLAAIEFNEFVEKQKPLDQKLLKASVVGYRQREIAEMYGFSQSYISRRLRVVRQRYASA